ncbi:MAG: glycosyltransferase family 2 protein [Dehalogenimonas sp.]|uniref:Glycosyltransferase family 2 protein n=1 Tax=Candidatus Dehalogenimonas loeffleri TaxID=3127115 RepID=A0ABZ2J2K3_9CHLR|nr:glycosyltransferase family 2 protein [Dehalogenimonas sp.]
MKNSKLHLSIIIPTYNEVANIHPLLERIHIALKSYPYDVLIVDDNSPDGTAAEVGRLAADFPVTVVVRTDKRGLASAVVDGFSLAQGQLLAVMDADLQHPPEVMADLLTACQNGADLTIASRYIPGGSVGNWSAFRRFISSGAGWLAHLLLPQTRSVKDPMSGCFLFRREILQGTSLSPVGYKILLEILCLSNTQQIKEVPYRFENRRAGQTKLSLLTQGDYLRHLFSLMRRSGEHKRIIIFIAVGASGSIVNLSILALLTENGLLPYLASGAVAFETAVIWNFILNDRFTFKGRVTTGSNYIGRLARFNLVSLGGLVIYLGILGLLTETTGFHYIISAAIGIIAAFGWNFLSNSWWTWR